MFVCPFCLSVCLSGSVMSEDYSLRVEDEELKAKILATAAGLRQYCPRGREAVDR